MKWPKHLPNEVWLFRVIFIATLITACGTRIPYYAYESRKWEKSVPPPSKELQHILYLIGDAGKPLPDGKDPLFNLVKHHLNFLQDSTISKQSSIVFLGDNIYEQGLPKQNSPDRNDAQQAIEIQLAAVENFDGRVFFIPGNHDWNHSSEGGYQAILRQQNFINAYLDRDEEVFLPKNGCPGPVEVTLGEKVVMIFLDSEWFLHEHSKPAYPDCTVADDDDFFFEFRRMVKRNEGKHIIVSIHHPLYSNGNHGGFFSLKDHIFPLSLVVDDFYLPLPVLGSFYALFRKYGISPQDIPNSRYQELKEGLLAAVSDVKNVTFASGHDHNLQLTRKGDKHFIVSGSASKINYARKGRNATYVHSAQGFSKIKYYTNGEVWIEFFVVSDQPEGQLTYRGPLYSLDPRISPLVEEAHALLDYSDSVTTVVAGKRYEASGFRMFLLGKHYRKEWTTPVKVNYLPINSYAGGLTPIKRGGGKQTLSLRMMGMDGNQYNLRSIDKYPRKAIPGPFRNTFAQDLVHDQISSAHPFGAFTVPPMAHAAALYHTNPKLVYIPFTPVLGTYASTFGGMTALMEIRPDEDLSEFSRFGKTQNAVSTRTMLDKLMKDNDNQVDSKRYLRSRLFDLLINDWDRHEDQWRWSEIEKAKKGHIFAPIPRDRDQVYTKYDGLIPWISSRKWAIRNLTHFDYTYDDPLGTTLAGNSLDRRLLNELNRSDWDVQIKKLQEALTDSVITHAIQQMPPEVFSHSGDEIIAKLKSRRDELPKAARTWYQGLNRVVDIFGTDKHEYFEVNRSADDHVSVTIFKTKKDGELDRKIYERTFDPEDTNEIRLYTFEGNDSIKIQGADTRKIKVRVVVGSETRKVENVSQSNALTVYKKKYYDKVHVGDDIRVRASNGKYFAEFDPKNFQYPYIGPRISLQFNQDAGLFVGAGANWKTYGYNRHPYQSSNTVMLSYATDFEAYNATYQGEFPDLFGFNQDLVIHTEYHSPQFALNFFGEGNASTNDRSIDFYRVDLERFSQKFFFQKGSSSSLKAGIGPTFDYFKPFQAADNITSSPIFDDERMEAANFLGGEAYFNIDKRDNAIYPRNGLAWNNRLQYLNNLTGVGSFLNLQSDLSLYLTPNLPFYLTFATRFGVQSNSGVYPFYLSNFLGGISNLRGYRMQRFAGRTAAFQNTELRLGVSKVNSYAFNGYWGVFGFIDHGRVWTPSGDGPGSDTWHRGYGPGIWINFFKFIMTSTGYGFSEEGDFFYVRAGLFF